MPKLKKEIFARQTRFTHRFGEKDDPITDGQYFDFKGPNGLKVSNSPMPKPFTGKEKGLHAWTEPLSPVHKARGGNASLSGPKLDYADAISEATPVGTRKRGPRGVI